MVIDLKEAHENCKRMQKLHDTACLGEWNAFVAKGETKEIRRARLFQCPDRFKEQVKSHVETVFKLKSKKIGYYNGLLKGIK